MPPSADGVSYDRNDRTDGRRSWPPAGHAHALGNAEGAARALRAADGAWPVAAALDAGAGQVVVVDSPARPLAEVLPDGGRARRAGAPARRPAVRPSRHRRGGRGVERDARCVGRSSGDVPLVSAAAIAELVRRTSRVARRRRWRRTVLDDPSGYGRVVRDARRRGRARRRDQDRRATPPRRSSRSARSTRASTRSTARRCWRRCRG